MNTVRIRFALFSPLLATLALATAPAVQAAGTVEYEVLSGKERARMSIEWLDNRRMRIDMSMAGMPANVKGWQVMRDGKIYSVTVTDGQTMVIEMGGMMKMMGNAIGTQGLQGADTLGDVQEFHSLKPTGRRETVAGVNGEVFLLDYRPGNGQRQQTEVVLSDQRTVREMTEAMLSYGKVLSTAMGNTEPEGSSRVEAEFKLRQLGMLRFGDQLKAVRVSSQAPSAQRLELPAAPISFPQIPGLANMGGTKPPTAAGGAAQRQVDRQQGRVAERAQAEADAAVDKAVDNAVSKALGKLLGR
jgi:hypothetical protein